jgi:hypothetical protein
MAAPVRNLIGAGELKAHYVGHRVRVYLDSAERYRSRNAKLPRSVPRPRREPVCTKADIARHNISMGK